MYLYMCTLHFATAEEYLHFHGSETLKLAFVLVRVRYSAVSLKQQPKVLRQRCLSDSIRKLMKMQ